MIDRDVPAEESIELRRNLASLRRGRRHIVLVVVLVTGVTVGVSLLLPRTYQATATIVVQDTAGVFGGNDVNAAKRGLTTFQRLLGTEYVLAPAARLLPDETQSSLRPKVDSSADPDANVIRISAQAQTAEAAASIANAVATTFLAQYTNTERRRLTAARANVVAELARQRARFATPEELAALESRIADIGASRANVGSQLLLAQPAERPSGAYAPRPVRNGLLAFFAALLLAVLWALARDRLTPRAVSARELSQLLGLPVLVVVPSGRRRLGRRRNLTPRVAAESYRALQSWVRFELPPDEQHIILVTSAVDGERTDSVVAGLGQALAREGQRTIVVSADLRFPTLHELFDCAREPGFTDVLAVGPSSLESAIVSAGPHLDLLPSGSASSDPATLLSGDAIDAFFSQIARLDYAYVLVEGSPLLGVADTHGLARRIENVLLVSKVERVTFDDVVEARDALQRLHITPLGLVVVDVEPPGSYAYAAASLVDDPPAASARSR